VIFASALPPAELALVRTSVSHSHLQFGKNAAAGSFRNSLHEPVACY